MAASQAHERNRWSPEEDQILVNYVQTHGQPRWWRKVPNLAGLNRTGKSCRSRWNQYLKPGIDRRKFSEEEENIILALQNSKNRNKWAFIATKLKGRTDIAIKNHWNCRLKKKLTPVTQTPLSLPSQINPRGSALRSYSDARLPNPHLQGSGFNYLEDPTVYQSITSTQTPVPTLLAVAELLDSTAASLRSKALAFHSYAQPPNLHSPHNPVVQQIDTTPDPEATGVLLINPEFNNYAADLGSMLGNVPHAGSTPALMTSESSERPAINQLENVINPPTPDLSWDTWANSYWDVDLRDD